jgi:hypothetical protein
VEELNFHRFLFLSLVRSFVQGLRFRRVGLFTCGARYVSFSLHSFEISTLCILVNAEFYSSHKVSSVSNASFVINSVGRFRFGYISKNCYCLFILFLLFV